MSALSVDNLRTLMGAPWDATKEGYGEIWVGLNGKRTIGQRRGVLFDGGVCNATDRSIEPPEGSRICYGWAEHNKALVDENGKVVKYYDPAGRGEFPAQVLADA